MVNRDDARGARKRLARRRLAHRIKHQWFAALFLVVCMAIAAATMSVSLPGGW